MQPLVRVSGWATVGVNPEEFYLGAVGAVERLLHDQGLKVENVDLFEASITEIEIKRKLYDTLPRETSEVTSEYFRI